MSEAKALIDFFNLVKSKDANFLIYKNENITLIVSGIGKINSCIATSYLKADNLILNIGICASAYQNHKIGDIFQIDKIIDKSSTKVIHHKSEQSHFNTATITCCDTPQNDSKKFKNTLIDMESFGFFKASKKFTNSENIILIKVVSDKIKDDILTKKEVYELIFPHLASIKKILF